tara:strand:- start:530 stop:691 length:162 start_codon:yes stop_codon:yes gene_type:complete
MENNLEKAKKYEETKEPKALIDWEKVWSEHPYTREKMLRGELELPTKKEKKDA